MAINLNDFFSQFQGLETSDIGRWPEAPKWLMALLAMLAVVGIGWYFYLDDKLTELTAAEARELKLKLDYQDRLRKAVNLEVLKKQKIQVTEYVTLMERQLPDKAEMDKLLSDINYAGTSKGLVFELFRPNAIKAEAYYAELPISIKISGTYHKLASFAADIAALPRIVTLNNMNLSAVNTGNAQAAANGPLTLESTVKTFRYLDPEEVAAAKKAKALKESAKQ